MQAMPGTQPGMDPSEIERMIALASSLGDSFVKRDNGDETVAAEVFLNSVQEPNPRVKQVMEAFISYSTRNPQLPVDQLKKDLQDEMRFSMQEKEMQMQHQMRIGIFHQQLAELQQAYQKLQG